MPSPARGRLAFPLDVDSLAEAREYVDLLSDSVGVFKVGLQLYTAAGPDAVRAVVNAGARCFLDLKLHDIPNTMAEACRSAVGLGASLLTVHCSAGPRALGACAEAVRGSSLMLLGVTVLTSMDDAELERVGVAGGAARAVPQLARLAHGAGLRGFVCSPQEAGALRAALGSEAYLVTPGIRPADAEHGDQQRVATPAAAIAAGADLLVVGRPIREARDPRAAAAAIVAEIALAS
jgi:orotidine-5'-phosphate decarboxylase